jgi:hypothetical protein
VAWLGPHRSGGVFDPVTQVSDTLLAPYLTIGGGA